MPRFLVPRKFEVMWERICLMLGDAVRYFVSFGVDADDCQGVNPLVLIVMDRR